MHHGVAIVCFEFLFLCFWFEYVWHIRFVGKRLAPEYEKAATALVKNDPPVALVKVKRMWIPLNQIIEFDFQVDCTVETKICGKYGVNGYPSMFVE